MAEEALGFDTILRRCVEGSNENTDIITNHKEVVHRHTNMHSMKIEE